MTRVVKVPRNRVQDTFREIKSFGGGESGGGGAACPPETRSMAVLDDGESLGSSPSQNSPP